MNKQLRGWSRECACSTHSATAGVLRPWTVLRHRIVSDSFRLHGRQLVVAIPIAQTANFRRRGNTRFEGTAFLGIASTISAGF